MRTLSKQAEAKLLSALEDIAELVNEGSSPNEAIIKIARQEDLPSGHVKLVTAAYNTGATTAQRESGDTALEKAADFRLADADTILDALYPKVVKTSAEIVRNNAVSSEYGLSPVGFIARRNRTLTKQAAAEVKLPEKTWVPAPRDEHEEVKRLQSKKMAELRQAEEVRRVATIAYHKAAEAMDVLAEYFRHPENCAFNSVKKAAEIQLGTTGISVLDKIAAVYPHLTKQVARRDEMLSTAPALSLIQNVVDAVETYNEAKTAADKYKKEPDPPPRPPEIITGSVLYNPAEEPLELKKADALSSLPTGPMSTTHALGEALWSGGGSYIKTPDQMRGEAFKEITDPDHERKLRNIRAQGVLADLVTNDPVISGHDPREVATAFNELSEIAPNFMDSTATVQALLRKRLESGGLADFDIKQLAELEKIDAERQKNIADARSKERDLI